MSNYCILRISKIKSIQQMQAAYEHNYRLKEVPNEDPELEKFNHELITLNGKTYAEAFQDYIATIGYGPNGKQIRKNGILALELVLTFSKEAAKQIDISKWEHQNIEWILNTFPTPAEDGTNILSVVSHVSESVPHIHAVLCCVDPSNNLNASYFIDGPAKLHKLQNSYATAMKPLGLERGVPESSARHVDIRRFYGELNRALDVTIPEWTLSDSPESYQKKVKEDIKDRAAIYLRKEKEHEKELRESHDIHKNEIKKLEKQLSTAKRNVYRYKQKQEEFEREVGPINVVKKTVEIVRLLRVGLEDMDTDQANDFVEQMNQIIVRQRHKEREKEETEKKRQKSIFEKVQ